MLLARGSKRYESETSEASHRCQLDALTDHRAAGFLLSNCFRCSDKALVFLLEWAGLFGCLEGAYSELDARGFFELVHPGTDELN